MVSSLQVFQPKFCMHVPTATHTKKEGYSAVSHPPPTTFSQLSVLKKATYDITMPFCMRDCVPISIFLQTDRFLEICMEDTPSTLFSIFDNRQ